MKLYINEKFKKMVKSAVMMNEDIDAGLTLFFHPVCVEKERNQFEFSHFIAYLASTPFQSSVFDCDYDFFIQHFTYKKMDLQKIYLLPSLLNMKCDINSLYFELEEELLKERYGKEYTDELFLEGEERTSIEEKAENLYFEQFAEKMCMSLEKFLTANNIPHTGNSIRIIDNLGGSSEIHSLVVGYFCELDLVQTIRADLLHLHFVPTFKEDVETALSKAKQLNEDILIVDAYTSATEQKIKVWITPDGKFKVDKGES